MYLISTICTILKGQLVQGGEWEIRHLLYDSRRIQHPETSLFFAIKTAHNDGHRYLSEAYQKGIRAFVVSEEVALEDAVVIRVDDTLAALQALAAWHRSQFSIPVIGITGSNGKTVVKEWLTQMLEEDFSIVRSPKSFNSQLGVPLSVWELGPQHTLGIFEAGISTVGEMENLQKIIQPTIGILTNIGEAHNEGFVSLEEKLQEKLLLFKDAEIVIGEQKWLQQSTRPVFSWSREDGADVLVRSIATTGGRTEITVAYDGKIVSIQIPFIDDASIQNAITCVCILLFLKKDITAYRQRFLQLHPVDMRLQLQHAINNCLLVNDSYSADINSLTIALHFLAEQSSGRKQTVILSDFQETGRGDETLYAAIANLLLSNGVQRVIAIGEKISVQLSEKLSPSIAVQAFTSTENFIENFRSSQFAGEIILLKGARKAGFERIAALFEQKLHGTVLQINLSALAHNLRQYQKILQPSTRIMAMVKAFSYGSGGAEIASVLQFHNTAYLGVAYADEGIDLVKAGITVPIMVMNPEASSYAAIVDHALQPVLYSAQRLAEFEAYINSQGLSNYPVHLEVETGMNRLGLSLEDIAAVAEQLAASTTLHVQSLFSHLAASESPEMDDFTNLQAKRFIQAAEILRKKIAYPFLQHISNTAGIIRHPQLQMDMVRLGIGLYGIAFDAEDVLPLEPVATLRSTIAQIKTVKKGESVSYNRRGVAKRDSRIATVRIGYADGYSRRFGNGVGKMWVRGSIAPVIGTVCMDMTMIDITDISGVKEGDDVIVFGKELPVQEVAAWGETIPYEIMTSVSQRVKRVYYYE
ncbi:bifunctional UDP-N-acetylmuramoyl-tripeptide:D-alanyl-D-alanine ligase/alanine racemase [Flavisolibacter sp. BT320]|nr:bifunctional UDP-N-acetylmuramoyl-tripeptide:D-alanyl-D-alanine ligase/alanine racemase [Flavisolibacter longurius]